MIKRLRNQNEVAHIWASQSQAEGSAGSMFFDGPTIYSYGRHYAIARIYKLDGERLVLFNCRGYSVTTAKHKSITRRAVSHLPVIEVFDHAPSFQAEPDHKENADYFKQQAQRAIEKARRAVGYGQTYLDDLTTIQADWLTYAKFFKIKKAAGIPTIKPAEAEKIRAKSRAWSDNREKRYQARHEAARIRAAADLDRWKAGETVSTYNLFCFPVALRIKDDRVETTRGAAVSIWDAIVAAGQWQAGTLENGQQIGPYNLNSWSAEGVKIGCHDIPAAEIEKLIKTLEASRV